MRTLLENGYQPNLRPSGHDISDKFSTDNGAAIPPNLLAIANTESNSPYLRYCREKGLKTHPARFPLELPEFFVRMLTDEGDSVLDPFAGRLRYRGGLRAIEAEVDMRGTPAGLSRRRARSL